MPNIEILSRYAHSAMLEAIQASNKMKIEREAQSREVVAAVSAEAVLATPNR
jgi:hypothetical protein